MKRTLACIFALCLLLLCGCSRLSQKDEETFYFPRKDYQYDSEQSVICPEIRDMSGHLTDFDYQLRMYLMGPLSDTLLPAFPAGTRLISCETVSGALTVTLSDGDGEMSDIQFTLACACLSKTCIHIWGVSRVTVIQGSRSLTLAQSDLLLLDTNQAQTDGGKK